MLIFVKLQKLFKMRFKNLILIFSFLIGSLSYGQKKVELSPDSKISILTIGTADELHSKFGHTAIRILDNTLGIDVIYNYGHFDFNTPGFYTKFTRGKLLYSLAMHRYSNFVQGYRIERRWVKEQVLNLSQTEKQQLLNFLIQNHLPENKDYKYDFLFENCATKIPEILKQVLGDKLTYSYNHIKEPFTFRELIHQNLETNSWSTFGIDLALGSVIDKDATHWEHQFLPLYVYYQLQNTSKNGKPLVIDENQPVLVPEKSKSSIFITTPLFWLILLLSIVLWVTYKDYTAKKQSKWLDFGLFFVSGLAGLLIFFLWFLTDHTATAGNLNLLWAIPLNALAAFYVVKNQRPNWIKKYLYIALGLIVLMLIVALLKIQIFSPLIIFVVLALGIRYVFLLRLPVLVKNKQ